MKKLSLFLIGAMSLLLFSCVATPVDMSACVTETPANFWEGLWHGMIAPFTFILSLFSDSIQLYDVNNNGAWYDFGFVLGAGILFGGGGSGASRGRRRKRD